MKVVPFQPEHVRKLYEQGEELLCGPILRNPQHAPSLAQGGPAFTGFDGDRVIACIGYVLLHEQSGLCWALTAKDAGRYFVPINRAILRFLAEHPIRRLTTVVDADNGKGHKWVTRILGFKAEGLCLAFQPDGSDVIQYARVRRSDAEAKDAPTRLLN